MALRNVLKNDEPILRLKAKEVKTFDENLGVLIDDMIQTMNHEEGVGLAAPQIGITRQICVISEDGETVYELINPVISKKSGEQYSIEGCLSVPGVRGTVKRPQTITVDFFDRKGEKKAMEVTDFLAIIFCHEIDHLSGILFTDHLKEDEPPQKKYKKSRKNA